MGWADLLGKAAKGYIQQRGVGGALEDLNSIKEGVSTLFGSSSSDDGQQAYEDDWDQTVDAVKSYMD